MQVGAMMTVDGVNYLTTDEVARRLDVKTATVYAYASRGVLTSVRLPNRRGSVFSEESVEELVRTARQRSGKRDPLNRVTTGLTLMTEGDLYFRGHRAAELAADQTFESVAGLLWTGRLERLRSFSASDAQLHAARAVSSALPPGAGLTDRLRAAVTGASAADPLRFDLDPVAVTRAGSAMITAMAMTLGAEADRGGTIAERLWPALSDRPAQAHLLNAALVMLADHDLAISTVAARVAASARAHPYAVVSASLGAFDGQYHGAASVLAYRFLAEVMADPASALVERLRQDQQLPGFGHAVYQTVDPRAEVLLGILGEIDSAAPYVAAVDSVRAAVSGRSGGMVNVDLALAVLMHAFGMAPEAGEAIFALARTAGWIGHALEEYTQPPLRFRPTGLYVGERPGRGESHARATPHP